MSKMAKFLASKKGKSSVKASADSTLQAALATPETESAADLLDNLKTATKAATDDWGADSDSEPVTGGNVVVGGHFHLISEEDVSKKQQRKPKKWGEVIQEKAAIPEEVAVIEPEPKPVEDAPQELKPVLYRPGMGRRRVQQKPLDVQNEELFPGLGDLGAKPTSSSSSSAQKKKEKKVEEKPSEMKTDEIREVKETSAVEEEEEKKEGTSLMLIEEFLHDVPKPKVNAIFNDDASKAKFIGRKKRPRVTIPAREH